MSYTCAPLMCLTQRLDSKPQRWHAHSARYRVSSLDVQHLSLRTDASCIPALVGCSLLYRALALVSGADAAYSPVNSGGSPTTVTKSHFVLFRVSVLLGRGR